MFGGPPIDPRLFPWPADSPPPPPPDLPLFPPISPHFSVAIPIFPRSPLFSHAFAKRFWVSKGVSDFGHHCTLHFDTHPVTCSAKLHSPYADHGSLGPCGYHFSDRAFHHPRCGLCVAGFVAIEMHTDCTYIQLPNIPVSPSPLTLHQDQAA